MDLSFNMWMRKVLHQWVFTALWQQRTTTGQHLQSRFAMKATVNNDIQIFLWHPKTWMFVDQPAQRLQSIGYHRSLPSHIHLRYGLTAPHPSKPLRATTSATSARLIGRITEAISASSPSKEDPVTPSWFRCAGPKHTPFWVLQHEETTNWTEVKVQGCF